MDERLSKIPDASAWILRLGVVTSVAVMLCGIGFSFVHGTVSVQRMESDGFEYRPTAIWSGILAGHGKSIIEAGIYMLLLTPILRIAASIALFAFSEHDWLYVLITSVVLLLTLAGLLWIN
jgi:uncharacterized membrane protein